MTTQTTKQTTKAAKRTQSAPKAFDLIAFITSGITARIAAKSLFYKNAAQYHAKAKTQFPRPRNDAARNALTKEKAEAVFSMHDKRILASGNADAQAMYDVYRMHAKA